MVFTNRHNPYFNRWFSAMLKNISKQQEVPYKVTILILIDGFLQLHLEPMNKEEDIGHNPYFNRWFSAI